MNMKFKIGDKVVLEGDIKWSNGNKYKTITDVKEVRFNGEFLCYSYYVDYIDTPWNGDELELYKEENSQTKVELLKDEENKEYIKLQKTIGNKRFDVSFYIDKMEVEQKADDIKVGNFSYSRYKAPTIQFDFVKNKDGLYEFKSSEVPKQMTKEDIEKELGYKIDIVG